MSVAWNNISDSKAILRIDFHSLCASACGEPVHLLASLIVALLLLPATVAAQNSSGGLTQTGPSSDYISFSTVPVDRIQLQDDAEIAFSVDHRIAKYRYTLKAPNDWLGAFRYLSNRWSEWKTGSGDTIKYGPFSTEGGYEFVVEAEDRAGRRYSLSTKFNAYWAFPEVRAEALTIDVSYIRSANSEKEKYRRMWEEVETQHDYWMEKWEYENDQLKRSGSALTRLELETLFATAFEKSFFGVTHAAADLKASVASSTKTKLVYSVSAAAIKLYIAAHLVRLVGEVAWLSYRNKRVWTATINAVITGWIAEYFRLAYEAEPDVQPDYLSLLFVLDSSGSMAESDPTKLRAEAVRLAVDRLGHFHSAGLIDFDADARVIEPIGRVGDRGNRLKNAARLSDASGGTHIGRALALSANALNRSRTTHRAALLITDGRGDYKDEIEPFVSNGWKLFTVGLGDEVNVALLSQLATKTGGLHLNTSSPKELGRFLDLILTELGDASLLQVASGRIATGEQQEISFQVDSEVEQLSASLIWPGSSMRAILVDPDGNTVFPSHDAAGDTYHVLQVSSPTPGSWTAVVDAIQTDPGGEPFQLQIGGQSELQLQFRSLPASIWPGDKAPVEVIIPADRVDLSSIQFTAELRDDQGNTFKINLNRERESNTILLQGEMIAPAKTGDYLLSLSLEGWTASGVPFTRIAERTVTVTRDGFEGRILPIYSVRGQFLEILEAPAVGLFPGLRVKVLRRGQDEVARGEIYSLSERVVTVRLTSMRTLPLKTDVVVLDLFDWQADTP